MSSSADLAPSPQNPRKITDERLLRLQRSLEEFGDLSGVIYNRATKTLVSGHQRCAAWDLDAPGAIEYDQTYETPTRTGTVAQGRIIVGGETFAYREVDWDEDRQKAANLAANRSAGDWDLESLSSMMRDLEASDFDLDLTMFDDKEIQRLLGGEADPLRTAGIGPEVGAPDKKAEDIEEAEEVEPPADPITKLGDLWCLGRHRIICGDSRDAAVIDRLMDGAKADMVATDPPYGVSYVGGTKDKLTIQNDGSEGLLDLIRDSMTAALAATRPGAIWYVAAPAGPQTLAFAQVLTELKVWRQTIVWVKNSLVMGHSDFHYRHEIIYYGWTPGGERVKPPDRKQDTVWEISRPSRSPDHPTMKPITMYGHMCEMSSKPGDLVFEPFSGSGTTLLASEQMGRCARAIELDPRYVDVAVRRWELMTGQKATREA